MPETVIREVAGQVDPAAKWIYSYPRLAAKRVAVGALSAVKVGKSEGGMSQTTLQKPFVLPLPTWRPLKRVVGAPRFELGTSWSRTKRATRLRYAPTRAVVSGKCLVVSAEDERQHETSHWQLTTSHCIFGRDGQI